MSTSGSSLLPRRFVTTAGIAALFLIAKVGSGQSSLTVKCVDPGNTNTAIDCKDILSPSVALQVKKVAVHVVDGSGKSVPNAIIRFYATSGRVVPDSTSSNALGVAATTWYRDKSGTPAVISVDARTSASGAFGQLDLTVSDPSTTYGLMMIENSNEQHGFEKAPLGDPIEVQLLRFDERTDAKEGAPVADRDKCPSYKVAFAQFGKGFISPDTAVMWYDDKRHGCFAYANWTLPDGAGTRDAKATLIGSAVRPSASIVEFEAYARALPRVVGGLAATRYAGYMGVKKGATATAKVERVLPDGTKITRDTTISVSRDTLQAVDAEWKPAAVIGVSVPAVPKWKWLSITGGVDLNNPTRDWYFGGSVIRPFGQLTSEGLPVDAHLLAHFGRSDVVKDETRCSTDAGCQTRQRTRFHGLAAMISVDATTLVSDLLKKIGI